MAMEVIPAVDLSGGRVVRLLQGDYGRVTGFDETPDEAADRFALAGAGWLHVIDLDAARDGERSPEHAAVLARLARRRGTRLQVGGGFRSREHVEAALAAGVQRVLIGTLAARDPDTVAALAAEHGPRICVCADALDGSVRVAGWLEDAGESASDFVERFTRARRGGLPGHRDRARRHARRAPTCGCSPACAPSPTPSCWQRAASPRSSTSPRRATRAATAPWSAARSTTARSTCARH